MAIFLWHQEVCGIMIDYLANGNNDANNYRINNNKTTASESFEYQAKIIGSIPINNSRLNREVVISVKYLSNFWRSFDLSLINCEIELVLTCSKYCVMS